MQYIHIFQKTHMTSAKCIEYCRGHTQSFSLAILDTETCTCGSSHSLDADDDRYILSPEKCMKNVTQGWNEMTFIGNDAADPPTVALYNIQHETTEYHSSKYGSSTCHSITNELMITQ